MLTPTANSVFRGGKRAVTKYNSYVKNRLRKYPNVHIGNEYPEIIKDLNEKGYARINGMFSREYVQQIRDELEELIQQKKLKTHDNYFAVVDDVFLNSKYAFEVATDDRIVTIANEFFQCPPAIGTANYRKSYVNNDKEKETLLFHSDKNSIHFIKFFLYLNDVKTPEDGPFTYVEGSHRDKFEGWDSGYRKTLADMEKHYSKDKIKYLLGDMGDVLIANTTGFHRGTKVLSQDRNMLTINYLVHPEKNKFKAKKTDINSLPPHKKHVADFLNKGNRLFPFNYFV